MKRKLFLLLPLLTAILFGIIYYSIYKLYVNIYKDELVFELLVFFSIIAELVAFLGYTFIVFFGGYKNSPKKENTMATIVFIVFTLQPLITLAGVIFFVLICVSIKAVVNYFKNPLDEKLDN